MGDIALIVKICYYLLFVLFLFLYAKYKYKRGGKSKFGIVALAVFAILFGVYGMICGPPDESVGDRHNYAIRFEKSGYEESVRESSLGLYAAESVLHLFTNESSVLFFVISVAYFCINIYCYKKTKEATPLYLLLLFLSTFGLFGFFALKQALSLAFMNLALTYYLLDKKKFSILFIVMAILCHEAAWVMIPCLVAARYCSSSRVRQITLYICVFAAAVFFPQVSDFFISLASHIPGMDAQLESYVDGTGSMSIDTNYFTIFKSAPYYIITFVAMIYRKEFRNKIKNYDFLLMLSVLCCVFSLLSMYMYWMFRFAMYCYMPCFLLATQMCVYMRERNVKIFKVAVVGILVILMTKLLVQYYFIYGGLV